MSAASPPVDGGTDSRFTLRLPEYWYDFSLADEAAENRIARSVWENCRATGVKEKVAARFLSSVRRAVRQARRAGALHAGGTSPDLAEADELFALFEEITRTLRLSGPQPVGGTAPAA